MRRILALIIALAFAVWGQSYAVKREFPWDAAVLYGLSALIFVFAVLPGLPHAADPPLALLSRLRRRGWPFVALGVILSSAAAIRFLHSDYSTAPTVLWLSGLALVVIGGYLLWARPAPRASSARPLWEVWGLCFTLFVAFFLRVYQLNVIPNGLYLDEADNNLEALRLFTLPNFIPFTQASNGHPTLFLYGLGLAFKAIGTSPFTMRLFVAVVGVLTVAAFYPLARQLFPRWLALALTFLLAVSRWHITFSRVGFEGILTPLAAVLTFYWLLRALRTRRPLDFTLAGLSLGAGMYTYLPFRVIPGVVVALLLAVALFDPSRLRGRLAGVGLMIVTALVAFAPLAAYFWNQPTDFYNRASQASVTLDMQRENSNQPLYENLKKTFLMFNWQGDPRPRHNLPGQPELDWVTASFYALGLAYAVARWRHPRQSLLIAWLLLMFAPGVLSLADSNPHSLRTIGNIPTVFLFAGLFLEAAWLAWRKAFGERGQRYIVSALIVSLAWAGWANYDTYFNVQAANRSVWYDFDPAQTAAAYYVREHAATERVYVSPALVNHPAMRFIPYGGSGYQVLNLNDDIPVRDIADRDVTYVLEPAHTSFLKQLSAYYPNGQAEQKVDRYGQPMFSVFRVSKEDVAQLQGVTLRYYPGLEGEAQPAAQVLAKSITANWRANPPMATPFRAEWSGSLLTSNFGAYTLILESSGEASLSLDDQEVIPAGTGRREVRRELPGGFHSLLLKVTQKSPDGSLQLSWVPPGGGQEIIPTSALFNVQAGRNGLLGRYYRNNQWVGDPALIRLDTFLAANDFVGGNNFSIEWQGKLYAPRQGMYVLGTNSDDGSQVYIDGELVVDNGGHHSDRYVENRVRLEEGLHDIRIRYFQDDGGRKFELWWIPPGGAKELVPTSNLFPPGQTPSKEELARTLAAAAPLTPAPPTAALQQVTIQSAGIIGGPSLFSQPRGVAVDAAGNIYVADTGNRKIHKLNPQGKELLSWGREGKGEGEFQEPFAVVVNSRGEVLVLDSIAGDVQRFADDGRFLGRLPNTTGLYRPRGMAIDKQDNLYIADTGGNRIVKLGPSGQPLGAFGAQGAGPGQFDQPTDVAVDGAGNMWVVDVMNQRLQSLDSQGQFRGEGTIGKAGTFNGPHATFSQDAVFVTDPDTGQVLLFSRDGVLVARLSTPGELGVPVGITSDGKGNLYVAEVGNHRVQKFTVIR